MRVFVNIACPLFLIIIISCKKANNQCVYSIFEHVDGDYMIPLLSWEISGPFLDVSAFHNVIQREFGLRIMQ